MIKAKTEDGKPVQIVLDPIVSALIKVASALVITTIIGSSAMLLRHETEIAAMKANRFTDSDARLMEERLISVREYDSAMLAIQTQLSRIEDLLREQVNNR